MTNKDSVVWGVGNKTFYILFATEVLADKFINAQPVTVGLSKMMLPVVGYCQCGERPAVLCDEPWGPACDLGNNEKYVKVHVPTASEPHNPTSE
jgi:hypothetical protein